MIVVWPINQIIIHNFLLIITTLLFVWKVSKICRSRYQFLERVKYDLDSFSKAVFVFSLYLETLPDSILRFRFFFSNLHLKIITFRIFGPFLWYSHWRWPQLWSWGHLVRSFASFWSYQDDFSSSAHVSLSISHFPLSTLAQAYSLQSRLPYNSLLLSNFASICVNLELRRNTSSLVVPLFTIFM